ncbi:phosphoribosylglycinamide formyltransferase [bacterium]|nr:MAG: phosphoribosylglycinamide formyltransferase [bacterium]
MKNIAVFASGNGSNFQAIVNAVKKGKLKANLKLLVCDNPKAYVLERANKAGISVFLIERQNYAGKKEFEDAIIGRLKAEKIGLIVLAGFMRILSAGFVRQFKSKILNVHPSLLPSFKGAHAIKDAFNYGVKVAGVTVHLVDEKVDHGPIILQEPVRVSQRDTLKSLEKKIHKEEHRIYPEAIRLFVSGRLKIEGRNVRVE